MAREDSLGDGCLFKVDEPANDRAPEFTGFGTFMGKKISIAGWMRTSKKSGKKFIGLVFDEPRERDEKITYKEHRRRKGNTTPFGDPEPETTSVDDVF